MGRPAKAGPSSPTTPAHPPTCAPTCVPPCAPGCAPGWEAPETPQPQFMNRYSLSPRSLDFVLKAF